MPRRPRYLQLLAVLVFIAACADPDAPTEIPRPEFDHHPLHIVVNSLADPGVGACDAAECTLREALATTPAGGRIDFSVFGTIALARTSGGLTVGRNVTISGPEPGIIVDGAGFRFPVFTINPGSVVTMSGLTIKGGMGESGGGTNGGGVLNRGDPTLKDVTVTGNGSEDSYPDYGTGIHNAGGTLELQNSTVSDNIGFDGAGIANFGGEVRIINSSVSMNVGRDGVGIYNHDRGVVRLVGSTVAGNDGAGEIGGGGGIYMANGSFIARNSTISGNRSYLGGGILIGRESQVVLQNTTVTSNESRQDGGGIDFQGGTLHLDNALVAQNRLARPGYRGPDLRHVGGVLTARFSLLGTADAHRIADGAMGNRVGVSPAELNMGPLASNGGPTRTHALGRGSAAIDAGWLGSCPEIDQRGVDRPVGGGCDMGSYEFNTGISLVGFFFPILNPPDMNQAAAGAVVKLRFRLKGDQGGTVLAPKSPLSQPIKCASRIPTGSASSTASENGVGLIYDPQADQYTYPWQTTQQWQGSCRQFLLRLADGSTYRADFDFRP